MTTQPTPKGAWKITFLLFLFMLVNFADKIVVGLAAVPIMTELKLGPQQFGLLGSSFFFLFSIAAIVVGFIVNRVPTRWVRIPTPENSSSPSAVVIVPCARTNCS